MNWSSVCDLSKYDMAFSHTECHQNSLWSTWKMQALQKVRNATVSFQWQCFKWGNESKVVNLHLPIVADWNRVDCWFYLTHWGRNTQSGFYCCLNTTWCLIKNIFLMFTISIFTSWNERKGEESVFTLYKIQVQLVICSQ